MNLPSDLRTELVENSCYIGMFDWSVTFLGGKENYFPDALFA